MAVLVLYNEHAKLAIFAGPKGFEPSTSSLTGRRSNQAELRSQKLGNPDYTVKIELSTISMLG